MYPDNVKVFVQIICYVKLKMFDIVFKTVENWVI